MQASNLTRRTAVLAAVLVVLLAFLAHPAAAVAKRGRTILDDPTFQSTALDGLQALYSMDFPTAEADFAAIEAAHPRHPAGPLLKSLVPWWNLLLNPEDPSHDDLLMRGMEQTIDFADRRLRSNGDDLDALFFKSGALAFRSRVHAYRGRWLRAANDGRRALSSLQRVRKLDPGNVELDFGIGLFDYLADVVPRQHPFLKAFTLFFPKGDRLRGLAELQRAADQGHFVATEAHYALYQLHLQFEKDAAKARADVAWLREKHPDNPLFQIAEARVYAQEGRWAESTVLFQEVAEKQVEGKTGYSGAVAEEALYWLARGEMANRRFDAALQYLDRLDYLVAEHNYDAYLRSAGRLRRGMSYDALGRRPEAVRCYEEVLRLPTGGVSGDVKDRAREFLDKPFAG